MGERFYICFYHDKRTYRSENQAYKELKIINDHDDDSKEDGVSGFRVFYCDKTGGYHHTSITPAELTRRQLTREGGNGVVGHKNFEAQRKRRVVPITSPKKRRSGQ